jgi:hypothetical protein
MNALLLVPPVLAALGAGLLTALALNGLADVLRYGLLGRRHRLAALLELARGADETELPAEEELYGVPRSVVPHMALAAAVGLALSWTLLDGPLRVIGLAAGMVPSLWKRRRMNVAREDVRRQVAQLIAEMRLHVAFLGSVGAVLNAMAATDREGAHPGRLQQGIYQRLHLHRGLISLYGPEMLLERLADEFRSPELRMLLRRLRAARRGGASYVEALRAAADEAGREVLRRARLEVEAAPMRLLFPMLILLFPPVMALLFYPLAAQVLAAITGAGGGWPMP